MKLLIDYFEEASAYIRKKKSALCDLERDYRHIYDNDIKKEMAEIRKDIAKKEAEIADKILVNLDEFRHLQKYFPDLLETYLEDEYIGKVVSRKKWLLNFTPMEPEQAAATLAGIRNQRNQLRDARKFLRRWAGKVKYQSFTVKFPVMKNLLKGDKEKDDALAIIEQRDDELRKQGWLILLNDSMIKFALSKFITRLSKFRQQEMDAENECKRMHGRGTLVEVSALRRLQRAKRKSERCEKIIRHILLANPSYLRSLKKKKHWLSREKPDILERFAALAIPLSIKEKPWLNEMKKKLKA